MYVLSICIPSLTERIDTFYKLVSGIQSQIDKHKLNDKVEIVSMIDNRTQPLSYKRNVLQNKSRGLYFVHLDDDDNVSDDYVITLYEHIINIKTFKKEYPDVIGYWQLAKVKGKRFVVMCDINKHFATEYVGLYDNYKGDNNIDFKEPINTYVRFPWQWCAWHKRFKNVYRSDIDTNAREDQNWLSRVKLEYPKSMSNIPKILHIYNFDDPTQSTCQ